MADLIYTNPERVDVGVLLQHELDASLGRKENNFELVAPADVEGLTYGSLIYADGEEWGGIVDGVRSDGGRTVTWTGRTWSGVLASHIIAPDAGSAYVTVSGDAHTILRWLVNRLQMADLFSVPSTSSGVTISSHRFPRYCDAWSGVLAMLEKVGAKALLHWSSSAGRVVLSAAPAADYSGDMLDRDDAQLEVEHSQNRVNHLICLGSGELAQRQVLHLYVDAFGRVVDAQYYAGLAEVADVYDYSSAESLEELRKGGVERLEGLRTATESSDVTLAAWATQSYDVGDIVAATDSTTGVTVKAAVTQKIFRVRDGVATTNYTIGGD